MVPLINLPTTFGLVFQTTIISQPFNTKYPQVHTRRTSTSYTRTNANADDNNDTDAENENNWEDQLEEESRKRFEEFSQKFLQTDDEINSKTNNNFVSDFPSSFSVRKNPFISANKKETDVGGGKASLYSDDELMTLLNVHNDISEELSDNEDDDSTSTENNGFFSMTPSIHDLVKQVTEGGDTGTNDRVTTKSVNDDQYALDKTMIQKVKNIQAIASDVDGTILSKKQTIHPKTIMAIRKAIQTSTSDSTGSRYGCSITTGSKLKYFFPATGKSRKGALDSISKASLELAKMIEDNNCPGVYLQGLFCVDQNGKVVFEKKLNLDAIAAVEELVTTTTTTTTNDDDGVSIVAYDGDDLYTTKQNEIVIHLHEFYGEPLPRLLPKLNDDDDEVRKLSSHKPSMHKLLVMDNDVNKLTNEIRPKLEILASKYDACVTQALPTMLELLPKGCSKALGVNKLCEALSINVKEELLAIGDAENDAGMLKEACIGVAVGNACPIAKDAADFILNESNDEGGAGVAIEMFTRLFKI